MAYKEGTKDYSDEVIKPKLCDYERGLKCVFLYSNNKSFNNAIIRRLVFNKFKTFQLDAAAVEHQIQRLSEKERIPSSNWDKEDWILSIRIDEIDKISGKKLGKQSYRKEECDNWHIWEKITLDEIKKDLITVCCTCVRTQKAIRS